MRITFTASYQQAAADLSRTASQLAERQAEVSSGKRVRTASDDPSAAAAIVQERGALAALDQFVRNADTVGSRLSAIDGVLTDIVQNLTAALSATLAARGTVVTPAQRETYAAALVGVRDAIFSDLTMGVGGMFLFSGSALSTPPYTRGADGAISSYLGNETPLQVDVDRQTTIRLSVSASAIAQGTDADDLFVEFDRLIAAVRAGDDGGMAAGTAALQRAFDRTLGVQSGIGTSMNLADAVRARVSGERTSTLARLSKHEDVDMAAAISGMSQAETAYRAALGAAGTIGRMSLMDYLR
jgi:flagellar hook-associated protein 3 FlgL